MVVVCDSYAPNHRESKNSTFLSEYFELEYLRMQSFADELFSVLNWFQIGNKLDGIKCVDEDFTLHIASRKICIVKIAFGMYSF